MPAVLCPSLSEQEKGQISFVHGNSCDVLATSVARLYEGKQGRWEYTNIIGACSVVVNRIQRTTYIRIVDLNNKRTIFEQEIYNDFDYQKSRDFFHTFEGDNTVYGLSFVDADEATQFQSQLQQQLAKKNTTTSYNGGNSNASNTTNMNQQHSGKEYTFVPKEKPKKSRSGFFSKILHGGSEDKDKGMEISAPTGFKHESHIGWDAENGFDIRNIPEDWRKLFSSVGIKKRELKNPETAQFILSVIGESVAQQNAANQGRSAPPPPPPTTTTTVTGRPQPTGIPPTMSSIPLTPIRTTSAPPPPPPTAATPRQPPQQQTQTYVYQSNQQPVTYTYEVDTSSPQLQQQFQQVSIQPTSTTPRTKPPVPKHSPPPPPTVSQKMAVGEHVHPAIPPRQGVSPVKTTPVSTSPIAQGRGSPPPPPTAPVSARGMSPDTVVSVSDTLPLPPPIFDTSTPPPNAYALPPPPMVKGSDPPPVVLVPDIPNAQPMVISSVPPPPPNSSSMPPMATSSVGGRNELLDDIRKGKTLKKVDTSQPLPNLSNLGEKGNRSLQETLFAAMEIRRQNMGENQQEQDDDSDDSDWEM